MKKALLCLLSVTVVCALSCPVASAKKPHCPDTKYFCYKETREQGEYIYVKAGEVTIGNKFGGDWWNPISYCCYPMVDPSGQDERCNREIPSCEGHCSACAPDGGPGTGCGGYPWANYNCFVWCEKKHCRN